MPRVPIYLDAQQAMERHQTVAERWQLVGRYARFDFADVGSILPWASHTAYVVGSRVTSDGKSYVCLFAGTSINAPTGTSTAIQDDSPIIWRYFATLGADGYVVTMGRGATLNTYAGKPVYDRGLDNPGTISDSLHSMVQLVDMGGVPASFGESSVPDWGRDIIIERAVGAEWQWLKAFLYAVRGSCKSFWLPSWRPDMAYSSRATVSGVTVLTVSGGAPTTWYPLHRDSLQLVRDDGTVTYVGITGVIDMGDGTSQVTLDVLLSVAAVTKISWLELCRLESDEVAVQFGSTTFFTRLQARVVQR